MVNLKKSVRKNTRVPIDARCMLKVPSTGETFFARICDISLVGVGITIESKKLKDRAVVMIDFLKPEAFKLPVAGSVVSQKPNSGAKEDSQVVSENRVSVRFEHQLSQKQFESLMKTLGLQQAS